MANINIFGVKFAYPRGLRKSPGTNWFAACVGRQMYGKKGGGRGGTKKAFSEAAHACKGQKGQM